MAGDAETLEKELKVTPRLTHPLLTASYSPVVTTITVLNKKVTQEAGLQKLASRMAI